MSSQTKEDWLRRECEYWRTAYPRNRVLHKFIDKILLELKLK